MRPLAIELAFDGTSDHRLTGMWSRLSGLYTMQARAELGIRPHVTLALFRRAEPRDVVAVAESLASRLRAFRLDLSSVGRFPGSEGVVFLRPVASDELAYAHAQVQALLAADRDLVDPYYRHESWQPHCTMAIGVPDAAMDAVLSACRCPDALGEVMVVRVQVVRYLPVTQVWVGQLGAASGAKRKR